MKDTTESNGLQIAENFLVWGSVAGTLVAVVAQQTLYATAPLTLGLLLNLSNRRRFEQKVERNITTVVSRMNSRVAQLEQELPEQIRSLQNSVKASLASKSVDFDTTHEEISQLQRRFDNLEGVISSLKHTTNDSGSQKETAELITAFDPTYLEQQIKELKTALSDKPQTTSETTNQQELEKCKQEIHELQSHFSLLNSEFQGRKEQQQIEELKQITNSVQQQLLAVATTKTHFDSSSLEDQIQKLQASVASLNTDFQTYKQQQQIEELRQIVESIQQHLSAEATAKKQTPFNYTFVARSRKSELENRKQLSVEALITMAKSNGIGEEFQRVLEVAKRHNLSLIPMSTNLMFTFANNLVFTVPSNHSRSLFIVSAQPTNAGKVQIWMSPMAEFYSVMREDVSSSLRFFDGWREMDKVEVAEFVTSLNRLLALTTANL